MHRPYVFLYPKFCCVSRNLKWKVDTERKQMLHWLLSQQNGDRKDCTSSSVKMWSGPSSDRSILTCSLPFSYLISFCTSLSPCNLLAIASWFVLLSSVVLYPALFLRHGWVEEGGGLQEGSIWRQLETACLLWQLYSFQNFFFSIGKAFSSRSLMSHRFSFPFSIPLRTS